MPVEVLRLCLQPKIKQSHRPLHVVPAPIKANPFILHHSSGAGGNSTGSLTVDTCEAFSPAGLTEKFEYAGNFIFWDVTGKLVFWHVTRNLIFWDVTGKLVFWHVTRNLIFWDVTGNLSFWDVTGNLSFWDVTGNLVMWDPTLPEPLRVTVVRLMRKQKDNVYS
ncbi:hypothetical protein INR49_025478 [Caranx melampygus]|nr:hypothetical protein INR49_025478 [Caranx melampygus]